MDAVGHRGAAGLRPENTLASFAYALELGVDAMECDVHLTRDARLAVIHDARVDRTTNGRGAVAEMTADDLQRLDAGQGEHVPLLEEVLSAVAGRVPLLIELKAQGTAEPALRLVEAEGLLDAVIFISFRMDLLQQVLRLRPSARVGAILSTLAGRDPAAPPPPAGVTAASEGTATLPPGLDAARTLGAAWVDLPFRLVDGSLLEAARAQGLRVRAWTPNSEAELQQVRALQPDAITTDRPDRLLRLLGRLN